ncbi:MAG TPA: hypothetical protein VF541_02205 [Longimicrobium sp.]|jgi:hypothetical protein
MIRTAFTTIFWGLVMTVVDVRINSLDLVPDFIGYLLVFSGLRQLAPLHAGFGAARTSALAMVVLSLPNLIGVESPLLNVIVIVGDLLIFWPACTGINALASAAGNGSLADAALTRRNLQALISAIALLGEVPARAHSALVRPFLFPLVIFVLAVLFLMLHLMWRAAAELAPVEPGAPAGG